MTGSNLEGYSAEEALDIAAKASEELKNLLDTAGVETLLLIAGYSGWGQPLLAHPNVGVHISETRDKSQEKTEAILKLSAPIVERGIGVAVFPKQAS